MNVNIRKATVEDSALIAQQRVQMFQDNQLSCVGEWEELASASELWLEPRILSGEYVGLLIDDENGVPIGGAGVWFMIWPPHYLHLEPERAYLLNLYVSRSFRGCGLARQLVRVAEQVCRERGVRVATLHASTMGKRVYTALDWKDSNEMMMHFG